GSFAFGTKRSASGDGLQPCEAEYQPLAARGAEMHLDTGRDTVAFEPRDHAFTKFRMPHPYAGPQACITRRIGDPGAGPTRAQAGEAAGNRNPRRRPQVF
ncbi:hypothetical protein RZS08_65290, partial [Arthrospira platensis SPKY1]|nr:hypothetical protein [Arthrospira platensis SPKY1]